MDAKEQIVMDRNSTPYSQLKVFYHQDTVQHLLKGERCSPVYIRIKPTNKCNHNCNYCHYRNAYLDLDEYHPADEIPYGRMMEIIRDLSDMDVKAVTFSGGGEPLLYPYIEETMEKVLQSGIDLSIITNGSLLKGRSAELLAKAKWVRISLESVNAEEYAKVRGVKPGAFEELCENIRAFSRIKEDTCELGINVVVSKDNYKEIPKMTELMKSLGVSHIKYAPLITARTRQYHEPFRDEVTRALEKAQEEFGDEKFRIINLYTGDFKDSVVFERQYSRCPVKEFLCVIAANSKVYYCHDKAYLSDGMVCDLKDASFKESWYSDETDKKFREFDARKYCKQHCVYDSRNELINSFLDMDLNHVNFI